MGIYPPQAAHPPISKLVPRWLQVWALTIDVHAAPPDPIAADVKRYNLAPRLRKLLNSDAVGAGLAKLEKDAKPGPGVLLNEGIKDYLYYACLIDRDSERKTFRSSSERTKTSRRVAASARKLAYAIRKYKNSLPPVDRAPHLSDLYLAKLAGTSTPGAPNKWGSSTGTPLDGLLDIYAAELEKHAITRSSSRQRQSGPLARRNHLIDWLGRYARQVFGHLPATLVAAIVSAIVNKTVDESAVRKRPALRK